MARGAAFQFTAGHPVRSKWSWQHGGRGGEWQCNGARSMSLRVRGSRSFDRNNATATEAKGRTRERRDEPLTRIDDLRFHSY